MKSATLVTALTALTKAMAVAAPVVVFGFLYILLVQPQRAASLEARAQLDAARDELGRRRAIGRSPAPATAAAPDEFEMRTAEGDRVGDVIAAIKASLNSPAVGGVSHLLVATGEPGDGPVDSTVVPASQKVRHTPVTLTFEARYEQIGRFFNNLRALPTTFDLRDVDLTSHPASTGLMKAKVSLLVFHRPGATAGGVPPQPRTVDAVAPPKALRDPVTKEPAAAAVGRRTSGLPAQPDPVVTGILVSGGRRVALVDGRIVRTGDRLPAGIVQSIDPDAVVIAGPGGQTRRLLLEKRGIERQTR